MNRREMLRLGGASLAAGGTIPLTGCLAEVIGDSIDESGVSWVESGVERSDMEGAPSLDAYVIAENTTNEAGEIAAELKVVREDGVRLTGWHMTESKDVAPGRKVLLEITFEAGDSGWADGNDLVQVAQTGYVIFRYYDSWESKPGDTVYRFDEGELTKVDQLDD